MGLRVEGEPLRTHLREERVVDHLYELDHAGHKEHHRQVREQDQLHRTSSNLSAVARPESTAPSTFGPA